MKPTTKALFLLSLSSLGLAACNMPPRLEDAQYWQRKSATSALYLRGPKAQQTLHQDISKCVVELNEYEDMGIMRETIPANTKNGMVPDPATPKGRMARWDTPTRDGYLYAEQFDYQDFEGCMDAKGWERIENMPYEQIKRSRDDYMENVYGYQAQTKYPNVAPESKTTDPYASTPGTAVNN